MKIYNFISLLFFSKTLALDTSFLNEVLNQLKDFEGPDGQTLKAKVTNPVAIISKDDNQNETPIANNNGINNRPSKQSDSGPQIQSVQGDRLPDLASTDFAHLMDYGCWCNFDSMQMGFGKQVDYVDSICKQLFTNYYCLSQKGCASSTLEYKAGMLYFYVALAVAWKNFDANKANEYLITSYDLCEELNEDQYCKIGICKAEVRFTFELLPEGLHQSTDNVPFTNSNGFYDSQYENYDSSSCRSGGMNGETLLECCGESPSMVRFNALVSNCVDDNVMDLFL